MALFIFSAPLISPISEVHASAAPGIGEPLNKTITSRGLFTPNPANFKDYGHATCAELDKEMILISKEIIALNDFTFEDLKAQKGFYDTLKGLDKMIASMVNNFFVFILLATATGSMDAACQTGIHPGFLLQNASTMINLTDKPELMGLAKVFSGIGLFFVFIFFGWNLVQRQVTITMGENEIWKAIGFLLAAMIATPMLFFVLQDIINIRNVLMFYFQGIPLPLYIDGQQVGVMAAVNSLAVVMVYLPSIFLEPIASTYSNGTASLSSIFIVPIALLASFMVWWYFIKMLVKFVYENIQVIFMFYLSPIFGASLASPNPGIAYNFLAEFTRVVFAGLLRFMGIIIFSYVIIFASSVTGGWVIQTLYIITAMVFLTKIETHIGGLFRGVGISREIGLRDMAGYDGVRSGYKAGQKYNRGQRQSGGSTGSDTTSGGSTGGKTLARSNVNKPIKTNSAPRRNNVLTKRPGSSGINRIK